MLAGDIGFVTVGICIPARFLMGLAPLHAGLPQEGSFYLLTIAAALDLLLVIFDLVWISGRYLARLLLLSIQKQINEFVRCSTHRGHWILVGCKHRQTLL
jgi:hypothetical protein